MHINYERSTNVHLHILKPVPCRDTRPVADHHANFEEVFCEETSNSLNSPLCHVAVLFLQHLRTYTCGNSTFRDRSKQTLENVSECFNLNDGKLVECYPNMILRKHCRIKFYRVISHVSKLHALLSSAYASIQISK